MGPQILVVDDNGDIRELITFILEDEGYSVAAAADADQALALMENYWPDLILLDVAMPGISGIQLLTQIRSRSNSSQAVTPVIMITAKSQESDIEAALKAGANTYIVKPFRAGALVEKIRSFIPKVLA